MKRSVTPGVVTVAKGKAEAAWAIHTSRATRKPFEAFSGYASTGATLPNTEPRSPRVRIGPDSGTARRFVRTPITATSSKLAATIGVVAVCAARETEIRFESVSGGFLKGLSNVRSTRDFNGFLSSTMPKTAATDSWKPVL